LRKRLDVDSKGVAIAKSFNRRPIALLVNKQQIHQNYGQSQNHMQ
jgi:hypothetical protein